MVVIVSMFMLPQLLFKNNQHMLKLILHQFMFNKMTIILMVIMIPMLIAHLINM